MCFCLLVPAPSPLPSHARMLVVLGVCESVSMGMRRACAGTWRSRSTPFDQLMRAERGARRAGCERDEMVLEGGGSVIDELMWTTPVSITGWRQRPDDHDRRRGLSFLCVEGASRDGACVEEDESLLRGSCRARCGSWASCMGGWGLGSLPSPPCPPSFKPSNLLAFESHADTPSAELSTATPRLGTRPERPPQAL
jgi:hypothetical protein